MSPFNPPAVYLPAVYPPAVYPPAVQEGLCTAGFYLGIRKKQSRDRLRDLTTMSKETTADVRLKEKASAVAAPDSDFGSQANGTMILL
jgi:hypothetical protein